MAGDKGLALIDLSRSIYVFHKFARVDCDGSVCLKSAVPQSLRSLSKRFRNLPQHLRSWRLVVDEDEIEIEVTPALRDTVHPVELTTEERLKPSLFTSWSATKMAATLSLRGDRSFLPLPS